MSTLIEIGQELDALDALISDANLPALEAEVEAALKASSGELTPEVAEKCRLLERVRDTLSDWFHETGEAFAGKVDNYAALIRSLTLRAAARREEMERLAMRVKVDESNAAFLKGRLLGELRAREIKKLETRRYKVTVAANGGRLPMVVGSPPAWPEDVTDLIPEHRELNREKLYQALNEGRAIEGAVIGRRGSHLMIK